MDMILISGVAFFAGLAQGATGFGFAIIALPLFLNIVGSLDAVGLTIVLSLLVSLVLVPGLWRHAPKARLSWLSVGSLIGFPIGLVIFLQVSLEWVRLAVGLIILFFALWLVARTRSSPVAVDKRAGQPYADATVGVVSGAMSTSLAMPGPSVILYLSASGMGKEPLRATSLCLFTLSYSSAFIFQAAAGAIGIVIGKLVVVAAIPAICGAFAGHLLSGRLGESLFRSIILFILLATGLYTTGMAIWEWI